MDVISNPFPAIDAAFANLCKLKEPGESVGVTMFISDVTLIVYIYKYIYIAHVSQNTFYWNNSYIHSRKNVLIVLRGWRADSQGM